MDTVASGGVGNKMDAVREGRASGTRPGPWGKEGGAMVGKRASEVSEQRGEAGKGESGHGEWAR